MAKSHYQRSLEEKIVKEMNARAEAIATGAMPDHAAYKFETGYLLGLKHALALAEETEKEME